MNRCTRGYLTWSKNPSIPFCNQATAVRSRSFSTSARPSASPCASRADRRWTLRYGPGHQDAIEFETKAVMQPGLGVFLGSRKRAFCLFALARGAVQS